ncbi:hypothetical protein FJD32_009300 [Shewanella sp. LC6]|nr:hypothetical protein FJD32_009300 [Shewanella sp. LC6]TPE56648.1 hypothetical protein FJD33_13890 [Shewanella sp. LC2]
MTLKQQNAQQPDFIDLVLMLLAKLIPFDLL